MFNASYTYEQKAAILLEMAKAFYNKGHAIQYDQYAMDRLVRITPRNTRYASPEMANDQHMLFLDCSTFMYALFYQTFGYQLESNLTWHIPSMLKPFMYEYSVTGDENREEKLQIRQKLLTFLQPGDIINKVSHSGSGHVVLYAGNGMIYHSTPHNPRNSYLYKDMSDAIYEHGTIYYENVDRMLDVDSLTTGVFAKNAKCFQIFRPLEIMGNPTPAAISRFEKCKDLVFNVLSSHPGGKTAWDGDTITYTLTVSNIGTETRNVDATVTETDRLKLLGNISTCHFQVPPGACAEQCFQFRLTAGQESVCEAPAFVANDVPIWAERVLYAPRMDCAVRNKVVSAVASQRDSANPLYNCILSAYKEVGITLPQTPFRLLFPCFRLIDSNAGDVLWRFPQRPQSDMALYSYFGGTGVITPELCADINIRVRKLWASALQPGDMVLISDDPQFKNLQCLFAVQDGLLSQTGGETICFFENGEATDKLLDTLPGRFCYIVFRPEQQTGAPIDQTVSHILLKY